MAHEANSVLGDIPKKNSQKFICHLLQVVTPFSRFGIGRIGLFGTASRGHAGCSPALSGLESRNLMTGGVSFSNRLLSIVAPLNSGNSAAAALDTAHNAVQVTLNGSTQEFAAARVTAIFYESGFGGGDTFVNSTNI